MSTVAKDNPWAVLLCKWQDDPSEPKPIYYYENLFSTPGVGLSNLVDFFRAYSHGNLDLSPTQVFGWLTLPHNRSEYTGSGANNAGRQQLISWASTAATDAGIDLSAFFGTAICMNDPTDLFGDIGVPAMVCDSNNLTESPVTQEMLHGFGINHARLNGSTADYTDPFDVMSVYSTPYMAQDPNFGLIGPGLNAAIMDSQGWLDPDRVWTYPGGEIAVSLRPHHRRDLPGLLVAKIGPYYAEFRMNEAWDLWIPEPCVLVHRFDADGHSYLMPAVSGIQWLVAGSTFEADAGRGMRYSVTVTAIDPAGRTADLNVALVGGVIVPDLTDMTLLMAEETLKSLGLGIQKVGEGDVRTQKPAPGAAVPPGSVVEVFLAPLGNF